MVKYNGEQTKNLITTYKERSLHLALKKYFCPDSSLHEIKIGKYVADACDGETVFEIQTGNFSPLRKKLQFYLESTELNIIIIRPIAQDRRVFWLDGATGELKKAPRLSPRHEGLASGIADILYLKELLGNDRITFCFVMMEIDEARLLDGYGKQRKTRATSIDRMAGEIYSINYIKSAQDVADVLFPLLPDGEFDRSSLSKSLKINGLKLWSAQKLLIELGILKCEKRGKKLIFEKNIDIF